MKCLLTLLLLLGSLLGSSQSVRYVSHACAKRAHGDTSVLDWKVCDILIVLNDSSVCIHAKDNLCVYITGRDSIVNDKIENVVMGYYTAEDQYGIDCSVMTFTFKEGGGAVAIKYPDVTLIYKFKKEELQ